MKRGYFAIWRKFEEHPFWKEKREFSKAEAWIDLLWSAQHEEKPHQVMLGMKVVTCNYGETIKSLETWSKRWKWNKSRVRRFLTLLENMEQIRTKNETITTRITIVNYSQYDPRRNRSETEVKRSRNGSETIATPDKNVKNVKNGKNKDITTDEQKAFASRLIEIVSLRREIKVTPKQHLSWANTLRLMIDTDKVAAPLIKSAMDWYEENWMNDFVPVVESARSFREKWSKLLNAIERSREGPKNSNRFKSKLDNNREIQEIGASINAKTGFSPYKPIETANSSGDVDQDCRTLPE